MGKSIAIVSGKGGSGKTLIAAEVIGLFAHQDQVCILMDADTATGGLSYYLSLNYVRNITDGFTSYAVGRIGDKREEVSRSPQRLLQHVSTTALGTFEFLPIGDHRRLSRIFDGQADLAAELCAALGDTVNALASSSDYLVVDCRGGIDTDSLAVCRAVEDVIIVVEPDPTSFQASQHLVDVLTDNDLASKLRGFVINKAIDDPTAVARAAGQSLRTRYLGAVPLDVDAARAFSVSELPKPDSIFGVHVREAISRAYPDIVDAPPASRVWRADDYSSFNVRDPRSTRVGLALSMTMVAVGAAVIISGLLGNLGRDSYVASLGVITFFSAISALEPFRQLIGNLGHVARRTQRR